jgi:hypothetical protein
MASAPDGSRGRKWVARPAAAPILGRAVATLPGQVSWLVDRRSPAPSRLAAVASCEVAPHSQWRAHAGFSPASLFSPCSPDLERGTRAYSCFRSRC